MRIEQDGNTINIRTSRSGCDKFEEPMRVAIPNGATLQCFDNASHKVWVMDR